jgi:hypothetical protein
MGNNEWRHLKTHEPDDFALAVQLDCDIRDRDAHAYLHKSAVPLGKANLDEDQGQLWQDECFGLCGETT